MPQCLVVPNLAQLLATRFLIHHPAALYDFHGRAGKKRDRSPGYTQGCPRTSTQA